MTGKQIACERCSRLCRKCDKTLPTCGLCALDKQECVPRYRNGKRPPTANDNTEGEGNPEIAARLEQMGKELTKMAASMKKPRVNTDSTASSNASPPTPTPVGQSNAARQPSLTLIRVHDQGKRFFYTFKYNVNKLCAYLQAHSPEHIQLTWVESPAVEQSGRFLSVIAEIGLLLQIDLEWCSERGISRSEAKVPRSDLLNTIKSSKQYGFAFPEEVDDSGTVCAYYWSSGNDGDGIALPQVFGGIEITWIRPADLRAFNQWHESRPGHGDDGQ